VRHHGQFAAREDAVQEALLAAALQWPADGVPESPRGWLVTVASRRLIDELRRDRARRRREEAIAEPELPRGQAEAESALPGHDDTLALLFLCCHESLSAPSQIALTLRAGRSPPVPPRPSGEQHLLGEPRRALDLEHSSFGPDPAGGREAVQGPVGGEHAMAGHDDRIRVLSERRADCASRAGRADRPRDLAVGGGLTGSDRTRGGVYAAAEIVQWALIERDVAEITSLPVEQRHDGPGCVANGARHADAVDVALARQRPGPREQDLGEAQLAPRHSTRPERCLEYEHATVDVTAGRRRISRTGRPA
jgi:hypothetical protein